MLPLDLVYIKFYKKEDQFLHVNFPIIELLCCVQNMRHAANKNIVLEEMRSSNLKTDTNTKKKKKKRCCFIFKDHFRIHEHSVVLSLRITLEYMNTCCFIFKDHFRIHEHSVVLSLRITLEYMNTVLFYL